MSAVAPLTPSQSPPMLLGFYRYKGDKKENNIILPVTPLLPLMYDDKHSYVDRMTSIVHVRP